MALSRADGLCRLALRTQWACVRLLSSVAAGGEAPGVGDKPGRLVDLEALRRERALRPPAERTQPAPPRKAVRTLRSSREQLKLNKAIRDSTSVDAVLDLAVARLAASCRCARERVALRRGYAALADPENTHDVSLRGALASTDRVTTPAAQHVHG